ncbi:uncharacterized protein TNCV_389681 [Trichonephila clavipes]|nr:uncharacterized protein TNCV_389681 [Trichonephila clavipes]
MQTLKPQDHYIRLEFVCRFLAKIEADDARPWKILWSDETHFCLDGAENSQNCRIWDTSSPNIQHQHPVYSHYVTVWCGFTADFILEPFLFETLTPHGPKRCSVTSVWYSELFQHQIIPALQERQCL